MSSRATRVRARALLTSAGAVAAAALCLTGVLQAQPVPAAELNHLAAEMADPASAQQCTTASQVSYCLFPGFGKDLTQIEAPVSDVLALLPARPSRLTVRQVLSVDFTDSFLTYGYSRHQIRQWVAQLRSAPGNIGSASVIALSVGWWPASGNLSDIDFQVALATAEWAVGLPSVSWTSQCVPLDQARAAITIWLAILVTHAPAAKLQRSLSWPGNSGAPVRAGNTLVSAWGYPYAYQSMSPGTQFTEAGYLLAKAMTGLPEAKVSQVLTNGWATWLNPRTTDAQLAAALGIALPKAPAPAQAPGQPPQSLRVCAS